MNTSTSLEERNTENPLWELAQRIVTSSQFKSSPKLRQFFLYVVDCRLRDAPEEATEQQIGIHVFHREPGYNSSNDSIVRSQARLLRLRLAQYFAEEGAQEKLVIEIPKGHYLPVFRSAKQLAEPRKEELTVVENGTRIASLHEMTATHAAPLPRRLFLLRHQLVAITAGIALGILMGFGLGRTWRSIGNPDADLFWRPFLMGESPLVIYSNPLFTGTPYTGMKLVSPSSSASSITNFTDIADDTYTGTGEAAAIHDLTRLFDAHHAEFILKRSRLVTWDEAKSRNLIFIGASSQNSALQDLKTNLDFAIDLDDDHQGHIVNRHPLPNEPTRFKPSSSSDEYAIIASIPGVEPGTRIVIFSGLTTHGTQAAVEFMCNPDSAQQLIIKALRKSGRGLVPFESVLHIKMSGGVPMQADVAAIHVHGGRL
jgi:hypothetical protein